MAVAIVQSTGQVQSLNYVTDQALTGVTAGNTLAVVVSDYFNSLGTFTASIIAGGSGTFSDAITSSLIGGGGGVQTGILYLTNCPGGSITVEVSGTNEQSYFSFEIFELSGVDNTTPTTDAQASTVGQFPGTTSLPLTLTTSAGGMVFTSVTASYGSSVTFTPPTGYTQDYNDTSYAVANAAVAHIATTGTTQDATWVVASAGSMSVGSVAVAFKASGGAGASAAITDGLDHIAATAAAISSASGAVAERSDTPSATASVTLPTAAGAVTEHADSITAAASSTVSASAAIPEGHDAIGAAASPLLTASATLTEGHDVVAGVAFPLAQGSGAIPEGLDAFAARATLSTGIAGEGDIFEGRDILAASASAIAGASAALTEGHDAVASAGAVTLPAAQGAVTESRDGAAGTATVTYPSAVGTIREGLDAATGALSVTLPTAAGAALEGVDTIASRASVYAGVFGSGRIAEGADGTVGAALSGAGPALPGNPYYYAALPVRYFYAPLVYNSVTTRYFYAALPVRWFYALSNPNMTTRLDIKDPRETVVITLDATNDLATGETLTSITNVSITVATGVDPGPALALSQVQVNTSAITLGVNTVAIGKGVQAVCTSGLTNVTYLIAITVATTNADKVLTLKALLPVSAS